MNAAAKVGTYALGLAVVFGGALGVGRMANPAVQPTSAREAPGQASVQHSGGHAADGGGAGDGGAGHAGHTGHTANTGQPATSDTPGGLQVSQDGYTLNPLATMLTAGAPADFKFTVTGPDGRPVTSYQVEHDKKLHFIVASRDLTAFQHVHPAMAPDGTWSVRLALPKPGTYRAFADFIPTGGGKLTLGADLQAAGDFRPEPLPHVSRTATVDDYTVNLAGDLVPGRAGKLALTVSKDGKPVTDLQPYLGAYGHMVALRAGDLAYLHVHPDGSGKAGPEITFSAQAPSGGDYRLFLDFRHDGEVRTASFTVTATLSDGHAPSPTHDHSH
ncbi:hypothetical protein [Nonomuraea zeae]|uniref:DUF748 domain-containing protein n=1 Tax=Nonomuraea zeae TaxID=1642303 RepID=A0A5S4F931_9ACTN|nr:hypothetical protein [Nonomuraea zeae]TMR12996.1 hypothetical protein ETD85_57980 [Nonomuraea zeae]